MRNGSVRFEGKCGDHCFDGVYLKDGMVHINEVKQLVADGSIKLTPANKVSGLPAQMTDE